MAADNAIAEDLRSAPLRNRSIGNDSRRVTSIRGIPNARVRHEYQEDATALRFRRMPGNESGGYETSVARL